jgi:hypothetical protein
MYSFMTGLRRSPDQGHRRGSPPPWRIAPSTSSNAERLQRSAAMAIAEVLDGISDTYPECPPDDN